MTSVAISGNAAGAGVITVAAPSTASNYTVTLPTATTTVAGTDATQTLTNKTLGLSAGTTTVSPLLFTSGTNLTSATAGAVEYDGKAIYGTPIGTQRGIVPTQQYYRIDSALAGANVTTAQSIFGVGCTLSSSTVYEFEIVADLSKTAGSTSHTIAVGFGGTATINNIGYTVLVNGNTGFTTSSGVVTGFINVATPVVATGAIAATTVNLYQLIKGTVSINAGGTFIPQYTLSAAPGGAYSTYAGSFMRIAPIGVSGANTSVGTWA